MFKKYGPFTFDYEYPGYYAYYGSGKLRGVSVYFTPDYSEDGQIDIQVNYSDGTVEIFDPVKYKESLTPMKLYRAVVPVIDLLIERYG